MTDGLIIAIAIYDYNGNHILQYIMHTDITESKISEELKQKLLENEQQLTEELQSSNEELHPHRELINRWII